jgi:hypothetical protein
LGIETFDFFVSNNLQKENNLHNLRLNDVAINRLLLQVILPLLFLFYFAVIPWFYKRGNAVFVFLVDRFSLPQCPGYYFLPILSYLLLTYIGVGEIGVTHPRHGELGEFLLPYFIIILLLRHKHLLLKG